MTDKTGYSDVNLGNYSTQNPPPYEEIQSQHAVVSGAVVPTMVPGMVGIVIGRRMGLHPTSMQCVSCRADIVTRIEYKNSTRTHICATLICILAWPLAFLPYCFKSCKIVEHYCPICNAFIGTYKN